jgi:hypothetical protein
MQLQCHHAALALAYLMYRGGSRISACLFKHVCSSILLLSTAVAVVLSWALVGGTR